MKSFYVQLLCLKTYEFLGPFFGYIFMNGSYMSLEVPMAGESRTTTNAFLDNI